MRQGISGAGGLERAGRRRGRDGGRFRGQALVEMALVLVVLMMLSLGIVQFGIVYSTSIQLTNLAREGARFGAIHGTDTNVESLIEDYVQKNCKGTTVPAADLPDANITVTALNKTPGQPITVMLVYDMRKKFFLPVLSPSSSGFRMGFLDDSNGRWSRFTQTATMTIE